MKMAAGSGMPLRLQTLDFDGSHVRHSGLPVVRVYSTAPAHTHFTIYNQSNTHTHIGFPCFMVTFHRRNGFLHFQTSSHMIYKLFSSWGPKIVGIFCPHIIGNTRTTHSYHTSDPCGRDCAYVSCGSPRCQQRVELHTV